MTTNPALARHIKDHGTRPQTSCQWCQTVRAIPAPVAQPIQWGCPECHAATGRPIGSLALAECPTHGWVSPIALNITPGR